MKNKPKMTQMMALGALAILSMIASASLTAQTANIVLSDHCENDTAGLAPSNPQ
jgi:hypothetical protein